MSRVSRRRFLSTAASGTAVALVGSRNASRAFGANEAVRVGVVGLRGRGQLHMSMVSSIPGFRLAAVCDVDPAVLGHVVEAVGKEGQAVRGFQDVRELLACKDIDAITIATPNHWHSLAAIWACQAGKDVYVEKPVSHNIFEGRQLVRAARKYQRMVQVGTQARSNPDLIEAVAWVRAGNLGKIQSARGTCYKPRMSIGKGGDGPVPPGLDYDLWLGPAPMKPLTRKNLHYDWHWMYDYGNGDLGNQGVHEMDIARWFLGSGRRVAASDQHRRPAGLRRRRRDAQHATGLPRLRRDRRWCSRSAGCPSPRSSRPRGSGARTWTRLTASAAGGAWACWWSAKGARWPWSKAANRWWPSTAKARPSAASIRRIRSSDAAGARATTSTSATGWRRFAPATRPT